MKRSCSIYEIISDDMIQRTLLADVGINSKLISWEVEDFTKKGDNYASYVTSLVAFALNYWIQKFHSPTACREINSLIRLRKNPAVTFSKKKFPIMPKQEMTQQTLIICAFNANFRKYEDFSNSMLVSLMTQVNYQKDEKNYQISYIAKINPQRPVSSFTQMLEGSYKREMIVLNEIIGGMNKQLKLLNLEPIKAPKSYTRSFEKGKEIIISEDLRKKGFCLHERTKGFDLEHTLLVVGELARFHASSLLFEDTLENKSIEESFDHFEVWLDNFEICSLFNIIIGAQCKCTIKLLKNYPKYEKCISWLEKRMDYLARLYREVLSPSKSFNVLIHGDCRASNILFRNNENGSPHDVRFIDFQGSRKSSPSNDLIYFLFSSVESHVRRNNIHIIENAYYQSFYNLLNAAGKQPPFTLQELKADMKARKVFGLLSGLLILPASLAEGDEIWDLEDLCNDTLKDFVVNQEEKFSQLVTRDGPFKNRFLSVFDEMIESGVCDESINRQQ